MDFNILGKKPVERERVFVPESSVELQSQLFGTSNNDSDIPKAYMEEHEIRAFFAWKHASELLEKAGPEFEEAKQYMLTTMSTMVNLTRGRQGMNVVTILGRPQLPKRSSFGYEEAKYNPVPVKKNDTPPVQYYQEAQY